MPVPPYTLTWALDKPTPHHADSLSTVSGAPSKTEAPQSPQSLSPLDILRLETVFKALLDAQEERLKNSIHKRVQALMDQVQESHSKVIEAAEAVLKDRKKDRAEQARKSMAPPQLIPPSSGASKQEWDALMGDIQRIDKRLNDLTERFVGVADEPPDENIAGTIGFSSGKQASDSNAGVDVNADADADADADLGEFEYTGDGVVGEPNNFTMSYDIISAGSVLEPLPLPPQFQSLDPNIQRSEAPASTHPYQLPGQQCYPSPVSQTHVDGVQSREASTSQEPTPRVDHNYPFQSMDGKVAFSTYFDAFSSGESAVQTVRPQDVEPFPRFASTSSLSSLSSLSTISPQKVTGKRRRSPPTRAVSAKRNRSISLKTSSISWPTLIPHQPGIAPQRIYCDGCERFSHLECAGIREGDAISDIFLCALCEKFGLERAQRLSRRRTSNANETCLRPNCPQKRLKHQVKKEANKEYTIDSIVGRRGVRPNFEYLVKWEGYSVEFCEWKSPSDVRIELLLPDFEEAAAKEGIDLLKPTGTHLLSDARTFWGKFTIERIVGRRPGPFSKHEYLCKWLGWGVECAEWKPEQDFEHGILVEQFEHAAKHEQFNPRNSTNTILLSEAQVAWGNAPQSKYFPLTSARFLFNDSDTPIISL